VIDFNVTQHLIDQIKAIALEAANQINVIYQQHKLGVQDIVLQNKDDHSQLTEADLVSHHIIHEGLKKLTPHIPIVSEELTSSHSSINQPLFWLIDPLDGTKEFILGTNEFTINIALIQNGKPIFGLILAPALHDMYWGSQLFGSYMKDSQETKKISVSVPTNQESIKLVSSRNHSNQDTLTFADAFPNKTLVDIGSSLKFCLIA
jgi:3'(2'), 5'-bisphosphate nucleotidase